MMGGKIALGISVALGLCFSTVSLAHHGSAASYDRTQTIDIIGTVTDVQFANPHVLIFFDVAGNDGSAVNWSAGLTSRNRLTRVDGWDMNTVRPGDRIVVRGSPARNGAPSVWVEQIFRDGTPLLTIPGGAG